MLSPACAAVPTHKELARKFTSIESSDKDAEDKKRAEAEAAAAATASAGPAAASAAATPAAASAAPSTDGAAPEPKQSELYEVFRKRFHVPKEWSTHVKFQQLTEHRYPVGDLTNTIAFVQSTLAAEGLGYKFGPGDDELRMEHDYICYLLEDMLRHKGVPVLTEKQLREADNAPICQWLGGTPDLLVRGIKNRSTGTYIVDVYTGGKDLRAVKAQYKNSVASHWCEPVVVLHPHNLASGLDTFAGGVLSPDDVKYLMQNFQVFRTEAQYWRSCLKMGRILRNDRYNVEPKELVVHDAPTKKHTRWRELLLKWAAFNQTVPVEADEADQDD